MVVSRFCTTATKEVVRVRLAGGTEIVGTPGHRTWSIDRQEFIGLSEFQPGERVDTLDGPAEVIEVETGFETQQVFNLEVAGQHVYRVGQNSVLVHNVDKRCVNQAKEAAENVNSENPWTTFYRFTVGTPSKASWKDHGARLFSDLKTRYGDIIEVTWKRTAKDAPEKTALAFQTLIDKGAFQYAGKFTDSVMGNIKVYKDGDFAYVFSETGQLMTRMKAGQRNWIRVFGE